MKPKNGQKSYGKLGWFLLTAMLVSVIAIGAWGIWFLNTGGWRTAPAYSGDLPFAERQSAAEYSEDVVPVIKEFVAQLGEETGVEIEKSIDDFFVNPCQQGVEVRSPRYSAGPGITLEAMLAAGNEVLIPAGFEQTKIGAGASHTDPDSHAITWEDSKNGGQVNVYFNPNTGMGLDATSGCRPEN